jgi:hypothetical protein
VPDTCDPPARMPGWTSPLRYFALDGTGHAAHKEQASMSAGTSSDATTTPTTNASAASSTGQT